MTAGRSGPPRDALAATDLWVPIDATGEDFYALGSRYGSQAGVLHEVHDPATHAFAKEEGAGFMDPWALRWHDLKEKTRDGLLDQRLSISVVNDYEGEYADAREGDAPFGQHELFTSRNRSTREVDLEGRVALPGSHRRIIDSEDDRFALALTCRSVPLGTARAAEVPVTGDSTASGVPAGMLFREAGTLTGTHGSSTTSQPSVSVGGVTFFGGAAVQAAKDALAAGGSAADAARWASAAARGLPRPPLQDAGTSEPTGGSTRTRTPPPEPDTNEEGSVPLLDHPAGYVWSLAKRVGLLGTLVCPEGANGHYFLGREGTPIGPLPLRHDAQVSMGPGTVGRIVFVADDAAQVPEGTGKPIKGELWQDTSRKNQDTELGHETTQWRPVVRVDADLPPSRLPPPEPPPGSWVQPDPEEEEEDEDDDPPGKPPRRPGRRGSEPPPRGRGPGESSGDQPPPTRVGMFGQPIRRVTPQGEGGELPPVANPQAQLRDWELPGEPCPNLTAGLLQPFGPRIGISGDPPPVPTTGGIPIRGGVGRPHRVPGGWIEYSPGHPGLTPVPGGFVVGGFEGQLPLGLPGPRRGGIEVEPGPDDGVPRGARVPGDDPGQIPLGLPTPPGAGLGFEPPPGGDRGVPRGWAERQEQREREDRARRARQARDKAEQKQIDELEDLEQQAREAGKQRYADKVKRARQKLEKRRQKREERRRRREEFEEKQRKEREERRRRREERKEKRRRKALEDRERRTRQREDERERRRRGFAQGGYMIPVQNAVASGAGLGEWNVLNRPLPFFGSEGGPGSIEDWAHMATFTMRALQRTTCGAFGGPGWLAANVGVVHRNGPGCPPAGSRLGAHWSVLPDEPELVLCTGESPLEVVSILDAPAGKRLKACSGGVLRIVREHRGDGLVDDLRPLLLLENARSHQPDTVQADLVSDLERRFYVDHERAVTGARLRAHQATGERGPSLEAGRVDPHSRHLVERHLAVEEDGTTSAVRLRATERVELRSGAPLDLFAPGADRASCRIIAEQESGALVLSCLSPEGEEASRLELGPRGLRVIGDLLLEGKLVQQP